MTSDKCCDKPVISAAVILIHKGLHLGTGLTWTRSAGQECDCAYFRLIILFIMCNLCLISIVFFLVFYV